ncbi:MAG TPA: CapA family protein, partial [Sphingomicrobium sp.]|nr:CapA family protein [Sphingomicrobium sp.]
MTALNIVMAGDVMLGRGIDQVLPQPAPPELHEPFVKSALDYVALAERRNGRIPRPIPFEYVWGEALGAFAAADVRIINLETSVTRRGRPEPKGIHYRMAPEHVPVLSVAGVDCCILANNHVLDWGCEGLLDTLDALHAAGIQTAGAGRDAAEASTPARITARDGRAVLVYALATPTSGVAPEWEATEKRPGVAFLDAPSGKSASAIADQILSKRRREDLVILSIHWGVNWGYHIPASENAFARELVDRAAVDVVLGHSSHHPKSIEVRRDRPILYGAGDLINDYE